MSGSACRSPRGLRPLFSGMLPLCSGTPDSEAPKQVSGGVLHGSAVDRSTDGLLRPSSSAMVALAPSDAMGCNSLGEAESPTTQLGSLVTASGLMLARREAAGRERRHMAEFARSKVLLTAARQVRGVSRHPSGWSRSNRGGAADPQQPVFRDRSSHSSRVRLLRGRAAPPRKLKNHPP